MLAHLRLAPLLTGWRSAPPIDLDAAIDVLTSLADFGARHPELVELELNPVLAWSGGALALVRGRDLGPEP
jgi:hypothetical protein